MKHHRTRVINRGLSCTALELSIGQILSIFWLIGDYPDTPERIIELFNKFKPDLLMMAKDFLILKPDKPLDNLKQDELDAVLTLFFEVNAAFFNPADIAEPVGKHNPITGPRKKKQLNGKEMYKNMSANLEGVTRQHHPNAEHYPFGYFLTVIDRLNEANKER